MRVIHITNTCMYLTKYLYVLGLYKMNICKLRKMSFEPNIYQEHLLCGFRLITKQQKQSNVRVQCTTSCPVTYRRHKPDSMIYKKKRRCDSQREAIFFQYFWIWGLNNEVERNKRTRDQGRAENEFSKFFSGRPDKVKPRHQHVVKSC